MIEKPKSIFQVYKEEYTVIKSRKEGKIKSFKTPWHFINNASIDGWEWGSIISICGMSGAGKTTVANQIVNETPLFNTDPIGICFFSLEMNPGNLINKQISNTLKKNKRDLYTSATDKDLEKIKEMANQVKNLDIQYYQYENTADKTGQQIDNFLKTRLHQNNIVVYDHSAIIKKVAGASERDSIVALCQEFNKLKRKYGKRNIYILVSQLNRKREDELDKPYRHYPKKADMFGSDAPYTYSDVVFAIANPFTGLGVRKYGPHKLPAKGYLYGHILKDRNAEPGTIIPFKNTLEFGTITELNQQEYKDFKLTYKL